MLKTIHCKSESNLVIIDASEVEPGDDGGDKINKGEKGKSIKRKNQKITNFKF